MSQGCDHLLRLLCRIISSMACGLQASRLALSVVYGTDMCTLQIRRHEKEE